jgi:hypothetical protein
MKQKVVIDYGGLSDANLKVKSENVVIAMTNNQAFPQTTPTMAEFAVMQTNFATALEKAVNGDRILGALKNQAREVLLVGMNQLAGNVNFVANGDKAILLSSGFDLTSPGESVTFLDASILKMTDGNAPGELKFNWSKVEHAISYALEWTKEIPTANTIWHSEPTSIREFIVKNLDSGTRIYARVRAIGHKGLVSVSEVQTRIVQ